jgi:hypothetical protein
VRFRVLLVAALAVLAVPSATAARTAKRHHPGHGQATRIVGTWTVQVAVVGQTPFPALITINPGGGVIETESANPGTGQGAWKPAGRNRFAYAFQTYLFSGTGAPAGHVLVRGVVTLSHGTLSGPFKFEVSDPSGNTVQSGSGTVTATRFVIPPL